MNLLVTIISFFWYYRIVKNILTYVHLWYVKEYRLDRMWIHLHTKQGKTIFFPEEKRPPISPKTVLLVVSLIAISASAVWYMPFPLLLRMLCVDILTFPLSALLVSILSIPTKIFHMIEIQKAVSMLSSHKPMHVIGITGSYGKTSTKEFLANILSSSYRTIKTEKSMNSPVGIAEIILGKLKPNHEAFVVEMGAYKKGEIKHMCDIVRPEAGIITAINAQHQDLFKSLETTKKAKYELIQGLVGKKIAICNMDNPHVVTMMRNAQKDGCEVWGFTTRGQMTESRGQNKKRIFSRIFMAKNIRSDRDTVQFSVLLNKKTYAVKARVRGEHFVSNILGAIAGAHALSMPFRKACIAASKLRTPERMMELLKGRRGETLINDTFNNNPDAAKAAIDYLHNFKGRKMLVFQPMIELGSFAYEAHKDVGKHAGKHCDKIYLTNSNFSEGFIEGVHSVNPKKIVCIDTPFHIAEKISQDITLKDTVLCKGKEAQFVLHLLRRG